MCQRGGLEHIYLGMMANDGVGREIVAKAKARKRVKSKYGVSKKSVVEEELGVPSWRVPCSGGASGPKFEVPFFRLSSSPRGGRKRLVGKFRYLSCAYSRRAQAAWGVPGCVLEEEKRLAVKILWREVEGVIDYRVRLHPRQMREGTTG